MEAGGLVPGAERAYLIHEARFFQRLFNAILEIFKQFTNLDATF